MIYRVPDYYSEFQCVAGACEDTCCAGWKIMVDKAALKKYMLHRGSYRKVLWKKIHWKEGSFRQDAEKRCAFLNSENLCEMYTNIGEKSLCKTCKLYPRHVEEFEGVREISLSLSCPEVARILLNRTEKVMFLEKETEVDEEYEDFDLFLYSVLQDVRGELLYILQDRSLPVEIRTGLVYGIAHDVQRRVNRQELFSCGEVLEKYQKVSAREFVEKKVAENKKDLQKMFIFARKLFRILEQLEVLKEDWSIHLFEVIRKLFRDQSTKEYFDISEGFYAWIKDSGFPWEIQKEQLLVYFIFTYFCGAVYDGEILKKVQMAIISVDLIEEMLKVRWLRNDKMLDIEDVMDVVYRYSREVEHSDQNLKEMEEMMPREHARFS